MDNNIKQPTLTKTGFESLQKEYDELVNVKRPHLVERLARARGEGDLSENADYSNAKEELDFLDGRISELEEVLKGAVIVDETKTRKSNEVSVGAKVTLLLGEDSHVFDIVGEWEADPLNKKISPESPLGQALIGKKVGDTIEVEAPAGKILYEILGIE